jgi:8-oxo-dGTP diphosphatase
MNYVLGFVLDITGDYVLLIKKQKPAWQKDRYNGIGGKIEAGESDTAAMAREANEEIGMSIDVPWIRMAALKGPNFQVSVFKAYVPIDTLQSYTAQEVEPIAIFGTHALPVTEMITNLRWLIPLALDGHPPFAECHY